MSHVKELSWKSAEVKEIDYQDYISNLALQKGAVQNPFGHWVIGDYEIIRELLKEKEKVKVFSLYDRVKFIAENFEGDYQKLSESLRYWVLFLEGSEHTFFRKILNQQIYELNLENIIQEETDKQIDEIISKNSFDLIQDFTNPLIVKIMARIINLPTREVKMIREFSNAILRVFEPDTTLHAFQGLNDKVTRFEQYVLTEVKPYERGFNYEKTNQLWENLTKIFPKERWGELFSVIEFFTISGIETSVHLIGRSLFTLIQQPTLLNDYQKATSLEVANEELIRYISPITFLIRMVKQEIEIEGVTLQSGTKLFLSVASANRNPEIFIHPNLIDFNRQPNPHLSFGFAVHYCIGAKLSRMEMNYILPAFFKAFPKLNIVEESIEYEPKVVFRGLKNVLLEKL
jgi:cytochrome P450